MEQGLREVQFQRHTFLWALTGREGVQKEAPYLCPESRFMSYFTICFLKKDFAFSLFDTSVNVYSNGKESINLKNKEVC